jgi:hypothetical protein
VRCAALGAAGAQDCADADLNSEENGAAAGGGAARVARVGASVTAGLTLVVLPSPGLHLKAKQIAALQPLLIGRALRRLAGRRQLLLLLLLRGCRKLRTESRACWAPSCPKPWLDAVTEGFCGPAALNPVADGAMKKPLAVPGRAHCWMLLACVERLAWVGMTIQGYAGGCAGRTQRGVMVQG